ncbi:tyrosine-type recombinase/integrase [Vibrio hepatarius]|uniref:tyrosine-type recombinase/integrase n=1 Tax=Vibrio hepatarius TaxID=171383 RepID=UPI00148E069E|nr:site-specific integrase [Vibrio hepatarius]NOI15833.1 site-specific integrase [Vibrio hepatarius]
MISFKRVAFYNEILGMTSHDLLDLRTGKSVEFYAPYLNKLIRDQVKDRNKHQNTIDAKANDLKVFFEYVYNAQEIFFERQLEINSTLLSEIILSYPDYLTSAKNAFSLIARETALVTGRCVVKNSTSNRMLSTVNGFIAASASYHEMLAVAKDHNLIDIDLPSENIHEQLLERRELSFSEKKALNEKSVMSQVVRGGAKYSSTKLFRTSRKGGNELNDYKHFPVEHLEALLDAAPTYRDEALWSLCAGAGTRISEASQLLLGDVNIVNEEIQISSYENRIECFEGLKYQDIKSLSFKGRETTEAVFIGVLKSRFFNAITNYLLYERPKGLRHNYLFVTLSNKDKGKPLFTAARSSLNRPIKRTQTKINCPQKNIKGDFYTMHSLRHFYGYWLVNFHTTPTGESFSVEEVQQLMGHAKLSSTQKYAVKDKIIAKGKMRLANSFLENNTLIEHRRKIIKALSNGY